MGGRVEEGGRRRGSCRSPSGGRWWRGVGRGGRGATWKSRRGREKTKAWGLALGLKLVGLAGWSGGGLMGKRRGGRRRSPNEGTIGRRARLGQGAGVEIPQGSNRVRLRRRFPSGGRPPSPPHDPSETPAGSAVKPLGEFL